MTYDFIRQKQAAGETLFAVLIDPDKGDARSVVSLVKAGERTGVDLFLVGGSLMMSDRLEAVLRLVRNNTNAPVVLFPGQTMQVHPHADALLLLSLISGRNADFLIDRQVNAAPSIRRSGLEVIPTGYMLIGGGRLTAVHYLSATLPLPQDKPELAACTAMAGEMLGLKMMYLEAGSGAEEPVRAGVIGAVRAAVEVPVVVGGGLREARQVGEVARAGADLIVVGTVLETQPALLPRLVAAAKEKNPHAR
ncbi:MAG TPA: geranylgeranylglyceryl/heptaprenylglyceryl phosphate synthase [Bacteroidales bacterium]|nr:geranylgeranylglyceryl/heptaprenylglyceryl phosphate synthase [Bacteroidales bacterium]